MDEIYTKLHLVSLQILIDIKYNFMNFDNRNLNNALDAMSYFSQHTDEIPLEICRDVALLCRKEGYSEANKTILNYIQTYIENIVIEKSKNPENLKDAEKFFDLFLAEPQKLLTSNGYSEITKHLRTELGKLKELKIAKYISLGRPNLEAILTNIPKCSQGLFLGIMQNAGIDAQTKAIFARSISGHITNLDFNRILRMISHNDFAGFGEILGYMQVVKLTEKEAMKLYNEKSISEVTKLALIGLPSIDMDKRISLLVSEWNNFKYPEMTIERLSALIESTMFLISDDRKISIPRFMISSEANTLLGSWLKYSDSDKVKTLPKEYNLSGYIRLYTNHTRQNTSFGTSMLHTILHEMRHAEQNYEKTYIEELEKGKQEKLSAIFLSSIISRNSIEAYLAFKAPEFFRDYENLVKETGDAMFFTKDTFNSYKYFKSSKDYVLFLEICKNQCKDDPKLIMNMAGLAKNFAVAVLRHDDKKEIEKLGYFFSPYSVYKNGWNEYDARTHSSSELLRFCRIAQEYGIEAKEMVDFAISELDKENLTMEANEDMRNLIVKIALNISEIPNMQDNEIDYLKESAYSFVQSREEKNEPKFVGKKKEKVTIYE